jgi:Sulfotransferase family
MPDDHIIRLIVARFPSPKFIFIYRDLLRVADSFLARARNPADQNWPASEDHKSAVQRWQQALTTADTLIGRVGLDDVCIMKYEQLFSGDIRTCELMFRFLRLPVAPGVRRTYEARTADWSARQAKPLTLSQTETDFVERHFDRDALLQFDLRFDEQFGRSSRD